VGVRTINVGAGAGGVRLSASTRPDEKQSGLAQHLVLRASTELSRSLNKFVIEFMNRRTKKSDLSNK
jgi:hypothetical protein